MAPAIALWTFLRALFDGSASVALENVALRHQLIILQRSVRRPKLSRWDRILWVWLARLWTGWQSSLLIVQPATVLAWHRRGFRLYGDVFTRRVARVGIREILIAPHAPWQNPFAERLIGSIRRECLDHFVGLNDRHLRRLLRAYLAYYNAARPHQTLGNNSPYPRPIQPPAQGRIVAIPQVRASSPLPARRLIFAGFKWSPEGAPKTGLDFRPPFAHP
jgi:hypothetical protein